MVDAVLLEWEGVLADTRAARRDALRLALAAEGIAHTLADDDEQVRGLGVHAAACAILRHMGCTDPTLAGLLVTRATRAFADALAGGIVLAPRAEAFVRQLQSRARVAVVTRAARAETETVLRMAGLEDAVALIVSADDVADDPPTPAAYRRAISRLGQVRPVAAERVVAVVDSLASVRAARAAKVRVLVVGAPPHEAMEADAALDALPDAGHPHPLSLLGSAGGGGLS